MRDSRCLRFLYLLPPQSASINFGLICQLFWFCSCFSWAHRYSVLDKLSRPRASISPLSQLTASYQSNEEAIVSFWYNDYNSTIGVIQPPRTTGKTFRVEKPVPEICQTIDKPHQAFLTDEANLRHSPVRPSNVALWLSQISDRTNIN